MDQTGQVRKESSNGRKLKVKLTPFVGYVIIYMNYKYDKSINRNVVSDAI
ncbi:hypothetical protein HanIR_Chr04g0189611 [Helianthus annuus]|nr:hypothetical protein HanIR_Chr04g0189611 [Helianthus annuus]KAJ0597663.1 hypothetical protein HanHA89_Chr04g0157161 [Helianthus annuus]